MAHDGIAWSLGLGGISYGEVTSSVYLEVSVSGLLRVGLFCAYRPGACLLGIRAVFTRMRFTACAHARVVVVHAIQIPLVQRPVSSIGITRGLNGT